MKSPHLTDRPAASPGLRLAKIQCRLIDHLPQTGLPDGGKAACWAQAIELDQRLRVASSGILDGDPTHSPTVLGLSHPRIRVLWMRPVIVGPFLRRPPVHLRQLGARRRWDAGNPPRNRPFGVEPCEVAKQQQPELPARRPTPPANPVAVERRPLRVDETHRTRPSRAHDSRVHKAGYRRESVRSIPIWNFTTRSFSGSVQ